MNHSFNKVKVIFNDLFCVLLHCNWKEKHILAATELIQIVELWHSVENE